MTDIDQTARPTSDIRRPTTIAIAGAGLLGRLLAWRLARAGVKVTLLDSTPKQGRDSAGYVAAAMIAPYSELLNAEPTVFAHGLLALDIWPQWLQELEQDTGMQVPYQEQGSVVVAHQQDASELQRFYQRLSSHACVAMDKVSWVDQTELQALEPELAARFRRAIYLSQEGCLSNWDLYQALELALSRFDVVWQTPWPVEELQPGVVRGPQGQVEADYVLDCRGYGAKPALDKFRGVRGEVLWVKAPEVRLQRPVRLMHPRYQLYIAPKPDDIYVIGATEIESESMEPITIRSSLELQSALYSVHTGFAEATVLEAFANLRPAFIDNLPQIQNEPGLMRINGLYRHGYLLSPAVVQQALSELGMEQQSPWPEICY